MRHCGGKHVSKSKCGKKTPHARTFEGSDAVCVAGARDSAPCQKRAKCEGSISKNNGKRGTFEEGLERCISRGRFTTRDVFIGDARRSISTIEGASQTCFVFDVVNFDN